MITLAIAICTSAALTDCGPDKRLPMPSGSTMVDCLQVRQVLLNNQTGPLILAEEFKRVVCEQEKSVDHN